LINGTLDTSAEVAGPTPSGRSLTPRMITASTVAAIAAVALLLRLIGITTGYDTVVDELFYVSLGQSVGAGHVPPVSAGHPFLLHPPLFFLLESSWGAVFGFGADPYHNVFSVRVLQQLLAAGSTVLIFFLTRRLAGYKPAVVAAVLFVTDAYLIRQNSRVLLETLTLTLVLAGYLLIVRLMSSTGAERIRFAAAAGACFGLAVLTKDMALLVTTLPLAVLVITNWYRMRREAIIAGATVIGMYLVWVIVVVATGNGGAFWTSKASGLSRLLGASVTTGFNSPKSPSLGGQLLSQLFTFSGSYLIIALGSVAGIWLLIRPQIDTDRILGLFTASSALMLGYDLLFGTIEEHFLYFLAVPALLSVAVGGYRLTQLAPRPTETSRVLLAGLAIVLMFHGYGWARTQASPDDGEHRAYQWLMANAPAGSKVAWIAGQAELALAGSHLQAVPLGTPAQMAAQNVTYLFTVSRIVEQGYSFATPESVGWFARRGSKVFSFMGRSSGEVAIYQTDNASVW
jgi:4-amino-4-deoxy-L-arabinose transferase-like glycosyltransferase